jgi:mono/diheme cytochrome c family protein
MRWIAIMMLAATACAAVVIPQPTPLDAERAAADMPGLTLADLEHGRRAYLVHCSGCHTAPAPSEHTPDVWREQVTEMRDRAKLTAGDERLVLAYLVTLAARPTLATSERTSP